MDDIVQEIRDNLCEVGESDLADRIDSAPSAEWPKMLEYTRYLVVTHGLKDTLHREVRSEIISHLWRSVVLGNDRSYLRMRILARVKQLVRECSDITSIEGELMTLAAAWDASFEHVADLHGLPQLVTLSDFD